ncbi:MAG: helix-turn-helix domain-containing protein [Micromonosporaceae bacterium]|nr:helix-turn-helix domain-containing protein [Micromonosporaceae bacterium]
MAGSSLRHPPCQQIVTPCSNARRNVNRHCSGRGGTRGSARPPATLRLPVRHCLTSPGSARTFRASMWTARSMIWTAGERRRPTMSDTAVGKAPSLLGLFTESRSRIGLSELATLSRLPKSTVQRLLSELEAEGFISQDADSRLWGIGTRPLRLAELFRADLALDKYAKPHMRHLADISGESVLLTIHDQGQGMCISRERSYQPLRFESPVGSHQPLYAGSSRKVILA